ncbi:hypothetical protein AB0K92_05290 [Streptomyces sp. NPDC052687]|uniref:hypothetical protein n=1 Tax=Streptomyces sp. NPDC052687 TaxID=3154759 RepID=UPI003412568B
MPARRLPSWAWVTGLTTGAIAAVAVLAVQATHGTRPVATAASPSPSASAETAAKPRPTAKPPTAVPSDSGTGRRIVYSLSRDRVWLIDASDSARRTFPVWPGTIDPDPGTYTVGTRSEPVTTGSDGVRIQHIVYFAAKSGVNIAFSHALDGSSPPPAPSGTQTGGIRTNKPDGTALWTFATTGTPVRVVK